MKNHKKMNLVTGNLFATQKYHLDAMVVFIPCGLTAMRCEWSDYHDKFKQNICDPLDMEEKCITIPNKKSSKGIENCNNIPTYKIKGGFKGVKFISLALLRQIF